MLLGDSIFYFTIADLLHLKTILCSNLTFFHFLPPNSPQEIEEEEDEGLSPARGNNNNRGGRGHSGGVGSGGGGNMYYNARK